MSNPWQYAPERQRSSSSTSSSSSSIGTPVSSEASYASERVAVPPTAPRAKRANVEHDPFWHGPSTPSSRSASASSTPSGTTATAHAHELQDALVGTRLAGAKSLRHLGRREPRAGDLAVAPQHSEGHPSQPRRGNPSPEPHAKRKKKVYCGNNRFDPSLRANGGDLDVGTRSACMRAGFGAALYQHVANEEEFIRKFSARYAPLVEQNLYFKDGPVPDGYQPATLSQARLRGWGAGSAELARRLRAKRQGVSEHRR